MLPVVEQQTIARTDGAPQISERRRDAARASDTLVAGDDRELIAGPEFNRLTVYELAGPDFGTAQVLQDADVPARLGGGAADARDRFGVAFVRAVGEVQTEDIDSSGDQFRDARLVGRGRAEGRDNLGQAMHNA